MKKQLTLICGMILMAVAVVKAQPQYSTRVSFGNEAQLGQFPSIVAFAYSWDSPADDEGTELDYATQCGGSVISSNMILTAAHCLRRMPNFALIGGTTSPNFLFSTTNAPIVASIDGEMTHPFFFDRGYLYNDIGIAFYRSYPDNATQVNLLPKAANLQGQEITFVGFGYTENETEYITSQTVLKYGYSKIPSPPSNFNDKNCDRPGVFCTASNPINTAAGTMYQGPCAGDSGSPLFLKNTNTQVGIVSFGPDGPDGGNLPCGEAPYAGYVNVTYYYNSFILPMMISYSYPDPPPKSSCPTQLKVSYRNNIVYVGDSESPEKLARKIVSSIATTQACGVLCRDDPQCYVFNYNKSKKACYLLNSRARAKFGDVPPSKRDSAFNSGSVVCAIV